MRFGEMHDVFVEEQSVHIAEGIVGLFAVFGNEGDLAGLDGENVKEIEIELARVDEAVYFARGGFYREVGRDVFAHVDGINAILVKVLANRGKGDNERLVYHF